MAIIQMDCHCHCDVCSDTHGRIAIGHLLFTVGQAWHPADIAIHQRGFQNCDGVRNILAFNLIIIIK